MTLLTALDVLVSDSDLENIILLNFYRRGIDFDLYTLAVIPILEINERLRFPLLHKFY